MKFKSALLFITGILSASLCLNAQTAPAQTAQTAPTAPTAPTQDAAAPQAATAPQGDIVSVKLKIVRIVHSNTIKIASTATGAVKNRPSAKEEPLVLWYRTGVAEAATWKNIMINPGTAANSISYTGPSKLVFYYQIPSANPEEPPLYKEVCNTMIPQGAEDMYLLMIKNNNDISFYSMNVSPSSLPRGRAVLLNMTGKPIAVSMGGEKPIVLQSGSHEVCKPKQTTNDEYCEVILAYRDGKEWKVGTRTSVPLSTNNMRYVLVAYNTSKDPRSMIIKTLRY